MFDIGFWELLVIGIVALVVLGPERLPTAVRSTAKTIRGIKAMANGVKQEVSQQLKIHEMHEHLKQAETHGLDSVPEDVRRSVAELKAAAQSVQQPYATKTQNKDQTSLKKSDVESDDEESSKRQYEDNSETSLTLNKNSDNAKGKTHESEVENSENDDITEVNTIHSPRATSKTNDSTK